jgi:hypothetical protein
MSESLSAGYEDFKALTRYNYYTTEKTGQVLVLVPEDLLNKEIKIDLAYKYRYLVRGVPVEKRKTRGLINFPLDAFPVGTDTIVCSFYVDNMWVNSAYVIVNKLPLHPNEVKIDHYSGGLIVDDLPFFPFGFYCRAPVYPTLPEEEYVKGFNMISPYQKIDRKTLKERKAYMDRCAEIGMKVHYNVLSVCGGGGVSEGRKSYKSQQEKLKLLRKEIESFRDHAALLAWYISDEPDGQGVQADSLRAAYNLIKELDPYHPVSIVFVTPSSAKAYKNVMDIVMADPYPIPNGTVTEAEQAAKTLVKDFYPEKPVWIVPQAFGGNEWWKREPTPQEVRAMTYLAILNNASGIQYFIRTGLNVFPKSTIMWSECSTVALETAELAPFLLSFEDQPEVFSSSGDIRTKAWEKDGSILIIAVNTKNQPGQFTIRIPDSVYSGKADVLFENRKIAVKEGRIEDMIDGLGTRLYKLSILDEPDKMAVNPHNLIVDPGFENSPVPGIPSACYAKSGKDRGATYFTDSRVSLQGSHSIRLTTPVKDKGVSLSFYPVLLKNNRSYSLSIWAKAKQSQVYAIWKGTNFIYRLFHRKQAPDKQLQFTLSLGNKLENFTLNYDWKKYILNSWDIQLGKGNIHLCPGLELISKGTAWFELMELVPDIEMTVEPGLDTEGIRINLSTIHQGASIRYTLDTTNPGLNSSLYSEPIRISNSALLKAAVISENQKIGFAEQHFLVNKATGKKVEYISSCSKLYDGSGDITLADGVLASDNYKDGLWQGFLQDVDLIIDLGNEKQISAISSGYLQDINVWIWLPTSVEYSVSLDGLNYSIVKNLPNTISERKGGSFRQEFTVSFKPVNARYIRVKAKSIGVCPDWHKGRGGKAWIFIDELTVE